MKRCSIHNELITKSSFNIKKGTSYIVRLIFNLYFLSDSNSFFVKEMRDLLKATTRIDASPDHSSAGRAEDCRVLWLSLGRWFDSGWSEFFYESTLNQNLK